MCIRDRYQCINQIISTKNKNLDCAEKIQTEPASKDESLENYQLNKFLKYSIKTNSPLEQFFIQTQRQFNLAQQNQGRPANLSKYNKYFKICYSQLADSKRQKSQESQKPKILQIMQQNK
eukprot:TRINITY_DN37307_c0_g1_i1.p2 TRINITY_DN37307_c0_g1~~TRINITY_DN37307_c0_g1_i1.p2  ORF type:complete len:120 (+),score=12.22 TRINITY_DN37307_c0_g1_i1:108-467(+)